VCNEAIKHVLFVLKIVDGLVNFARIKFPR
jgi:hypothetical protein